jgi:hypothetical protein
MAGKVLLKFWSFWVGVVTRMTRNVAGSAGGGPCPPRLPEHCYLTVNQQAQAGVYGRPALQRNGILAWFSARADEVIDLIDKPFQDAASL